MGSQPGRLCSEGGSRVVSDEVDRPRSAQVCQRGRAGDQLVVRTSQTDMTLLVQQQPNRDLTGAQRARLPAQPQRSGLDDPARVNAFGEVLVDAFERGPGLARGVAVTGIELSEPMVAQLRRKVDQVALPVVVGDMATTTVAGEFSLVNLVWNGISNLRTQEEQVACFLNAARHLDPGGRFVIELWVPPLRRLPPGQLAVPFEVGEGHLGSTPTTSQPNSARPTTTGVRQTGPCAMAPATSVTSGRRSAT